MSGEIITGWLKAGYPYLKEGAGLPSWLLPQRSLDLVADELQDSGILRLSRPLRLADSIAAVHDRMPDPSVFSAEAWRQAVSQWPPLTRVKEVVEAYLEVADRVTAQLDQWRGKLDPRVICRGLAVLLLAPLVPQGRRTTEEMAGILGGSAEEPGQLIRGYAEAVIDGDIATVERVNQCIVKCGLWGRWAEKLQQTATMKCRPRLIAVTPPLSSELISVLTLMIREEEQNEPGGDYSGHPANQTPGQ